MPALLSSPGRQRMLRCPSSATPALLSSQDLPRTLRRPITGMPGPLSSPEQQRILRRPSSATPERQNPPYSGSRWAQFTVTWMLVCRFPAQALQWSIAEMRVAPPLAHSVVGAAAPIQ
jgi:hypothetical protein